MQHNANTAVRSACFTYTVYSVVVRIVHVAGTAATNSYKPDFRNGSPGGAGLGNVNYVYLAL